MKHSRLTLSRVRTKPPPDRPQDTLAEVGSLQSASSNRSTGSEPTSRRDISGSSGSRSSARYSIVHSASVSSFENRRRYMSSLRYQAYGGSQDSGSISPTLSAFGSRGRRPDDGAPMLRNIGPLSEQHAAESGSSYHTAPDSMSSGQSRSTNPGTALMEIEEDVVDAARAAMHSEYDREFGMRSPRSPSDASLGLSSAPWAAGLDKNWIPL